MWDVIQDAFKGCVLRLSDGVFQWEGGREGDKKCPKWEFQFSNSASRQSLLVSHLLHSQFILWWRELPKSGARDPACRVSVGPLPLPPTSLPSKHRLLPKRSFNRVQSRGFQILCETDFDCRRLLQTLNGLFVDPFDSRRRASDILFISTILTLEDWPS